MRGSEAAFSQETSDILDSNTGVTASTIMSSVCDRKLDARKMSSRKFCNLKEQLLFTAGGSVQRGKDFHARILGQGTKLRCKLFEWGKNIVCDSKGGHGSKTCSFWGLRRPPTSDP